MVRVFGIFGFICLVFSIFYLTDCRREKKGVVNSYDIMWGVIFLLSSAAFFAELGYYSFIGYPAGGNSRVDNATYEVVSSIKVEDKQILILKEPAGDLRLFVLESDEIRVADPVSGRFLKAIKVTEAGTTKRILTPLVPEP